MMLFKYRKIKSFNKLHFFSSFQYSTEKAELRVMVVRPEIMDKNHFYSNRVSSFRIREAIGLVEALGHKVILSEIVKIRHPSAALLFGEGKLKELKGKMEIGKADMLMIDGNVTSVQERNLNRVFQEKIIDRFGIILEIFAQRAETREAKLQVSLAELLHKKARLAHFYDTSASQQRGGGLFLSGAGESSLEIDRRVLAEKEKMIKKELQLIQKRRQNTSSKENFKHVSFVGYTNVGKSCLINSLSGCQLLSENRLFSSLNTHSRLFNFPNSSLKSIFVDTVGFVSELPTQLVASFRSTFERSRESDLIVHVRDISSPETDKQYESVLGILDELEITPHKPVIEVWNKMDLLDPQIQENEAVLDNHPSDLLITHDVGALELENNFNVIDKPEYTHEQIMQLYENHPNKKNIVLCSARKGIGFEELIQKIESNLKFDQDSYRFVISNCDKNYGKKVNYLFENGKLLSEEVGDDSSKIDVMLDDQSLYHFLMKFPDSDFLRLEGEDK